MIQHHPANTIRFLKNSTDRLNVALLAFNRVHLMEEYYSSLNTDDVPHNMEVLFGDLVAIYDVLHEELDELRNYKDKLHEESK